MGRLVDLRDILTDKTLPHASQAGVGPLLKKKYVEPRTQMGRGEPKIREPLSRMISAEVLLRALDKLSLLRAM